MIVWSNREYLLQEAVSSLLQRETVDINKLAVGCDCLQLSLIAVDKLPYRYEKQPCGELLSSCQLVPDERHPSLASLDLGSGPCYIVTIRPRHCPRCHYYCKTQGKGSNGDPESGEVNPPGT